MNRRNSKIRGFTIFELLVGLVISAMLILVAFNALRFFNLQTQLIRNNYFRVLETEQFIANMKLDFAKAKTINRDFEKLTFSFEGSNKNYQFLDSVVLFYGSEEVMVDTIFISGRIEAGYMNNHFVESGIIDLCELSILSFNSAQNLIFTKHYSAMDLMNFNKQDEN